MATHEIKIHIMHTFSPGTRDIIRSRVRKDVYQNLFQDNSSLALLHGDVCDMIYASDMAQKAADVAVFEIPGSCPQHMTCLGILGDVAAVETAVARIQKALL